jgi:hypothetical protein
LQIKKFYRFVTRPEVEIERSELATLDGAAGWVQDAQGIDSLGQCKKKVFFLTDVFSKISQSVFSVKHLKFA